MILAADIGNTHIELGCIGDDGTITGPMQMSTDRVETAYEYAAEIRQILHLVGVNRTELEGSVISSVVPEVTVVFRRAFEILTGKEPYILGQNIVSGLKVDMNGMTADQIAGDLVATAVAAGEEYILPAIIIDIGTATTITVVNRDKVYIGGCIMPGPGTALKGMLSDTSLLPAIDFSAPERVIARDTVDAMKSGILFGSAGAIDGIIDRYTAELRRISAAADDSSAGGGAENSLRTGSDEGRDPTIIVTGGMGRIIAPYCTHTVVVDDHLLLKGLWLIWQRNRSR
ncbi:MAG: type III pantothenate kinase [Lachnospiraceae bacterium]|nr:type III pantothenate kinase [Lachnospiraceae bacterium]